MKAQQKTLYNIPAGVPFAKALAQKLLADAGDSPEKLAQIRILLPTRRACRALREAFLHISNGKPLLLPRMQPLGDIDEEELSLTLAGEEGADQLLALPPTLSPLRRQLELARLVAARPDFKQGPDHALALAGALGRLMDQVYTQNLDLRDLHKIVPADFAEHWQITLKFLEILSEAWPLHLQQNGLMDGAERRNRLILALNQYWQKTPPGFPVIAAGSTGSIPATAALLSTIAAMTSGSVILPGLDMVMDEESWAALEESHPQYGLRELLQHMNVDRTAVKLWPIAFQDSPICSARRALASEIMRPATTTGAWTDLATSKTKVQQFSAAFAGLSLLECAHEREEAEAIAVLLREALQDPGKTAALITPDRDLARRVAVSCARWGITIDDSAGQTLDQTSLGAFLRLCIQAALAQAAPVALVALLKHRLCHLRTGLQELEVLALRGPRPAPGFTGLFDRLKESEKKGKNSKPAAKLLQTLAPMLTPFITLSQGAHEFREILKTHIALAESLAALPGKNGDEILWESEEGEAASILIAGLFDHADLFPALTLQQYMAVFEHLLKGVTVRPAWGTHPRLSIFGQLEARLIDADLVIMGGLNEGTWPPDTGHDPWMSRPMRIAFGLPGPERSIGLAAHDFVQGFCAPHVVLTRARRAGGSPTVPARWLQRLDTVLEAAGLDDAPLTAPEKLDWARLLDKPQQITPAPRPAPRPPLAARPRKISATAIEKWLADPYSIYARYILNLRKLDPLEQEVDARRRGILLHEILDRFVREYPENLPENATRILHDFAQQALMLQHDDPAAWSFWWPRFARLSDWYLAHETAWRKDAKPLKTEAEGIITLPGPAGGFSVTARVDRIDRTSLGAAIIDYKSAGAYTQKRIKSGELPQLPVEALILASGGFAGLGSMPVAFMGYWTLTGGAKPGEITAVNSDIDTVLQHTKEGLKALIAAFDDPQTPYYSLPNPDRAPRFNDYEHLARVQEWMALSESETGEAA